VDSIGQSTSLVTADAIPANQGLSAGEAIALGTSPFVDGLSAGTSTVTAVSMAADGLSVGISSAIAVYSGEADPYFDNVVLLMHANGSDGSTTFTDVMGSTVTPFGNAQISTAQSVFGGSSIRFDGTGDGLRIATSGSFGFGTGDFSIELRLRLVANAVSGGTTLFDFRSALTGTPWTCYVINTGSGNRIGIYSSYVAVPETTQTLALNEWYHIAIERKSGIFYIFINGTQQVATATGNGDLGSSCPVRIGVAVDETTAACNAYMDEIRITKGVARYA
jgi:hypothetical protein